MFLSKLKDLFITFVCWDIFIMGIVGISGYGEYEGEYCFEGLISECKGFWEYCFYYWGELEFLFFVLEWVWLRYRVFWLNRF